MSGPAWADRLPDGGWELRVKAVPGARRSRVMGALGDHLKIQVAAPPEDGRANAALADVLADWAGVPVSRVRLLSGTTSPRKRFRLDCDSLPIVS